MIDLTVYSKYEQFVKQLSNDTTKTQIRPIAIANRDMYNNIFYAEVTKKCYSQNNNEMLINCNDKVCALLYVPCVDQYQKQYLICTVFVDKATHKILSTQCYKEAVNPMCINNANIKYILNELNKLSEER